MFLTVEYFHQLNYSNKNFYVYYLVKKLVLHHFPNLFHHLLVRLLSLYTYNDKNNRHL
jgi:hypothetical protein